MNPLSSLLREAPLPGAPELRSRVLAARERLEREGLPTRRDEDWRFFRAPKWEEDGLSLPQRRAVDLTRDLPELPAGCNAVVFAHGHLQTLRLHEALGGVVVRTLEEAAADPEAARALAQHGESFQQAFGRDGYRDFSEGLWGSGVEIIVPAGVSPEVPLAVVYLGGDGAVAHAPRTVVRLGAGSRLELIAYYGGASAAAGFTASTTDFEVARDASLGFVRVQNEGPGWGHSGAIRARQAAGSQVDVLAVARGARSQRLDVAAKLGGEGAGVRVWGGFLAGEGQHSEHFVRVQHDAPRTTSRQLFKGIADRGGCGVFQGAIDVAPGAIGIAAHQLSKGMLLSGESRMINKPLLGIQADEVKCSHGSAVGPLHPEELFYLQSRGISPQRAREMLCRGFLDEVFAPFPAPALAAWARGVLRMDAWLAS